MRYQTTVDWSSLLWVHLLTWHCNGTLVNMFVNHFVLFSDRVMLVNLDKWLLLCFTEPWDNERTPIFPFWQRVSWAVSGVMGGAGKECTWLYMTVYCSLHSNHIYIYIYIYIYIFVYKSNCEFGATKLIHSPLCQVGPHHLLHNNTIGLPPRPILAFTWFGNSGISRKASFEPSNRSCAWQNR